MPFQFSLDSSPVISTPEFSCKEFYKSARAARTINSSFVSCNACWAAGAQQSNCRLHGERPKRLIPHEKLDHRTAHLRVVFAGGGDCLAAVPGQGWLTVRHVVARNPQCYEPLVVSRLLLGERSTQDLSLIHI